MAGSLTHPIWEARHLCKQGHASDEYEDAWAANPQLGSFAIADGASESSFAAEWAQLLVNAYVAAPWMKTNLEQWLLPLQNRWAEAVQEYELPWYAEAKRDQGAFTTFLGLVIKPKNSKRPGRWFAVAQGDGCLFQVRDGRLQTAFPMLRAMDFSNRPRLLGSRSASKPEELQCVKGTWRRSDRFYLMTDALAQWFLQEGEKGSLPWDQIDEVLNEPAAEFARWIDRLRSMAMLRNDDVTLLRIAFAPRR